MYLFTDYVEPVELTGYARAAFADLQVNQFTLSRFLPNNTIDDLDYRFTAGGEGLVEAATFRAYDTPSPFGERPGKRRVSGELPPISRQIRLGEYERLRSRRAADADVREVLERDAVRMVRAISARMELARGQALVTGKVTINENGVVAEADFGRAGGNTVSTADSWANVASADVLTEYVAWVDAYVTLNGSRPEVALTSTKVSRLMQRNAEIINAVAGSAAGRTRVNAAELNALLQSENLPRIETYDAQVNVGGVATRVIADDKFILLPGPGTEDGSDLGATLWGTTAESLEPEYGLSGDEAGVVAGVYKQPNPVNLFTNAAGIGLPVLANPNLSFVADVVA
jgi:hypothetical protein